MAGDLVRVPPGSARAAQLSVFPPPPVRGGLSGVDFSHAAVRFGLLGPQRRRFFQIAQRLGHIARRSCSFARARGLWRRANSQFPVSCGLSSMRVLQGLVRRKVLPELCQDGPVERGSAEIDPASALRNWPELHGPAQTDSAGSRSKPGCIASAAIAEPVPRPGARASAPPRGLRAGRRSCPVR